MKKVLFVIFLAGISFGLGQLGKKHFSSEDQFVRSDFGKAPSFTLLDVENQPFSSKSLDGSYALVSFFFSSCQGPCPLLNSRLKKIHDEFSTSKKLKLVSISIDPERDTPEVLRKYSSNYVEDPSRWVFLTGTRRQVFDVIENGFAKFPETPDSHTTHLFLISPEGRVIDIFRGAAPEGFERLNSTLSALLN